MPPVKILLVQLASFGDCLMVTPIAKQIKEIDYPGCHLTWMIGSKYSSILKHNPYIDKTEEIPSNTFDDIDYNRRRVNEFIESIGGCNIFDKIFITDFIEANLSNFYGTTRSMLYRNYPTKLKIDPKPLIYLDKNETENVAEFCRIHKITKETFNVLFECSPQSGQSLMSLKDALRIANEITLKNQKIKFILSTHQSFKSDNPNVIDGSKISFRENAELVNHCDLLVGCSSGISWLCTTNYSKMLPFIQIISPDYPSASMKADFMYFGIDTRYLIELYNPSEIIVEKCIIAASTNKFQRAKKKFDTDIQKAFSDCRFLKESKVKSYLKIWFYLRFCSWKFPLRIYKSIKPKWFTPKVWIQKLNKFKTFL